MKTKAFKESVLVIGGALLPLGIWAAVKYGLSVPDRFLPSMGRVLAAASSVAPPLFVNVASTGMRLLLGIVLGTVSGITLGLVLFRFRNARLLAMPTIHSVRAIPPVATVPFFLLWFGFSEIGKYTIIALAIGLNVAVAVLQTLASISDKFTAVFRGFGKAPEKTIWAFAMPYSLEQLLPTMRFSVSTAIGAVVVAELLGSQQGLGYLIQTSRSTFSTHVIMLAAIILGLLSAGLDHLLVRLWRKLIFWRPVI